MFPPSAASALRPRRQARFGGACKRGSTAPPLPYTHSKGEKNVKLTHMTSGLHRPANMQVLLLHLLLLLLGMPPPRKHAALDVPNAT